MSIALALQQRLALVHGECEIGAGQALPSQLAPQVDGLDLVLAGGRGENQLVDPVRGGARGDGDVRDALYLGGL